MTNPTVPYQLQSLDPDTDAPRLMQNYEAILDWLQVEAPHRHHFDFSVHDVASIAGSSFVTKNITWGQPFASGVVPVVSGAVNNTGGTAFAAGVVLTFYSITNVGCTIRFQNLQAGASGDFRATVTAIDPTWDISL
jgi:hypothetical protein